jgi:HlyD family secretion protein
MNEAGRGAGRRPKEQRVWTLRDGQLAAITVTKGLSDGVRTEVVAGQLEPGMALVTDETRCPVMSANEPSLRTAHR